MNRNIIFLFNNLSVGGGLTFLIKFQKLDKFFNIRYFSLNKLNIKFHNIERVGFSELFNQETILVANSVLTALFLSLYPTKCKKFYVTHGYANAYQFLSTLKKLLFRFVLYIAKNKITFIACGNDEKLSLLKLQSDIKKLKIIHNSIDKNIQIKKINNIEAKKLIFIGRISFQKGLDLLLDSLCHTKNNIHLDIAGPFQQKEYKYCSLIKNKVKHLNKTGHKINFLGVIDINAFCFESYKCAVLPSRYEGFAFLPLELSSLNVPHIISDCLGQKELLVTKLDKRYSFESENKKSLAKILSRIIEKNNEELSKDFEIINNDRLSKYSELNFLNKYKTTFLA